MGLSALVAIPAPAFAQEAFGPHGPGGPPPLRLLLRSADLTPEQRPRVGHIMRTSRLQARPLLDQLHSIDEQIASKLLGAKKVTASDFTALQQQKAEVQRRLDQNMIDTSIQIRNLLSPAQLTKMAETHEKLESLHNQLQTLLGPPDNPEHERRPIKPRRVRPLPNSQ
jgi:Spy/CpxP family protein refolding chaperone